VASVGIRELLEAGVHFGHQTRRWNPKMRRFIFGERQGIYVIDLLKTERLLDSAQDFASGIAHRGGNVLFVGTKKQARDAVKEVAEEAGMPYVNHRWLGGLLTNFQTISLRIKRLHDLERYEADGQLALLPTRERLSAEADLEKLRANLGGVKHMQRPPDALFVVDLKTEAIAVREAQRLRIPIIGLVDTNCDPDGIDYVVPGNDDAMKACRIITKAIGDVVSSGRATFRAEEERARQEAEAQARYEAEERARKEAEEEARKAAEAAAEGAQTEATAPPAMPAPGPSPIAQQAAAEAPPAEPTAGAPTTQATPAEAPAVTPEPAQDATAAAKTDGAPETPAGDTSGESAADEPAEPDKSPVDQIQGVANQAVDTAQDAVAGVAHGAADVVETVGERLPGPLGGIAKAAAGAVDAAAEAVRDREHDDPVEAEKSDNAETSEEQK